MNLLPMDKFTLLELLMGFFDDQGGRENRLEIDRLIEGVVTRTIRL